MLREEVSICGYPKSSQKNDVELRSSFQLVQDVWKKTCLKKTFLDDFQAFSLHFQSVVFSPVVLTDLEHIPPGGNENHHILGVPHCCKNHSLRHIPGTLCGPFSFLRTIYQHTSYASDS